LKDTQYFGAGKDMHADDVNRLFYRLLAEEALIEFNEVNRAGFPTGYIEVSLCPL
jgi:hypothetical protein